MGINKKTAATFVTAVSISIGGEDKTLRLFFREKQPLKISDLAF